MTRKSYTGADDTFETVRRRHEQWEEIRPRKRYRRPRAYFAPSSGEPMSRNIIAGIGIGLGLLLLALAAVAFYTAWQWNNIARDGATVGYIIVGFFLILAGVGGIVATWNHNFRVLDPNRRPAPAHH